MIDKPIDKPSDNALILGDFNRKGVLIFGEYPIDEKPFTDRGLAPVNVTFEDAVEKFPFSKAIIIADSPSRFSLTKKFFEELSSEANNCSLLVVVLAHNTSDLLRHQSLSSKKGNNSFEFVSDVQKVAEFIARKSAGPPLKSVKIEPEGLTLDSEVAILLQRSFFDCDEIHLEPIGGGKASDGLYKVHAWMKDSEAGPLPLPFFAKIAKHDIIDREIKNYENYTDLYIPFRFRPNFRKERCVKTENYASLVGNFVDDAIPLRKALQDTHSFGILFSLFERSLRGFRIQPVVAPRPQKTGGLQAFIEDRIMTPEKPDRSLLTRQDVIDCARIKYKLKGDIGELYNKLLKACPIKCLMGPYHGDLNSRNVMVIGEDAILIDFSSINNSGPLTADPATIEISLCFELDDNNPPPFFTMEEVYRRSLQPFNSYKAFGFN